MKIIVKETKIQVDIVSDDGRGYLHIPRQGETISIASKKYRVVEVETRVSAGYHFEILGGFGKISDINLYVEEM